MMEWTDDQRYALANFERWNRRGVWYLTGYAGTGKTTLAKELARQSGGTVLFATMTGKAAHVLQRKGCENAHTIHSLIYRHLPKSKTDLLELRKRVKANQQEACRTDALDSELSALSRQLKQEEENHKNLLFEPTHKSSLEEADLLIVDECSMLPSHIMQDLLSYDVPIVGLGDQGQLPPVRGESFFSNHIPDAILTEITRQESDSPIIRLATMARTGKEIPLGEYQGSCRCIRKPEFDKQKTFHDRTPVLVYRNRTRVEANRQARDILGFTGTHPMPGERVVCLRNNRMNGLLNGSMWEVLDSSMCEDLIWMSLRNEDEQRLTVKAFPEGFQGNQERVTLENEEEADWFTFGYALTVHKAQGSEWEDVVLYDEMSAPDEMFRRRWRYTGVTRAAQSLTIVRAGGQP